MTAGTIYHFRGYDSNDIYRESAYCATQAYPQCSNNKDDDGDGLIDYSNDPGCSSASDNDEYNAPPCANECAPPGSIGCNGSYARTCGNYDADSCLEWNSGTYCTYGCSSGVCSPPPAPAYRDIGLRLSDGIQTIKIAIEPLGTLTSPLRIAKGGIVYGIVLVDTTDANASKMRVRTSSGIKAMRKY